MAKTKPESTEERLKRERENDLSHLKAQLDFLREPSYCFKVGDSVACGAFDEAIVKEVLYGGKAYGLLCISTEEKPGEMFRRERYRVCPWTSVRPLTVGKTNFTKNEDIHICFSNSTIESLLSKAYFFGVDFNPDYQRGFVWGDEDKEKLLWSVFNNVEIGKFAFIHLNDKEWLDRGVSYEILDGKQRLLTLMDFYENKIPYRGMYYNDLSKKDKRTFKNAPCSIAEVNSEDRAEVLRYFIILNRGGKAVDEEHLKKVEDMLEELTSSRNITIAR